MKLNNKAEHMKVKFTQEDRPTLYSKMFFYHIINCYFSLALLKCRPMIYNRQITANKGGPIMA